MALVDALGNLARFVLLPGQSHDLVEVKPLIHNVELGMFRGDKAFEADWLRTELNERGAVAVIPPKSNRSKRSTVTSMLIADDTSLRTSSATSKHSGGLPQPDTRKLMRATAPWSTSRH